MIKVEVIEIFTLNEFDKLTNIQRKKTDIRGKLFIGDTFECTEEMYKYLTGNNASNKTVVKLIELKPEGKIKAELKPEIQKEIAETKYKEIKKPVKNKKTTKK